MLLTQVSTNGHARKPNQDSDSAAIIQQMTDALRSAVVIDEYKLKLMLAALLAKGHILLEDVPGIGKTLVDKINRVSPRTHSSLLESMAKGQVTSDSTTHTLPQPFFIIATQNPIEMA